MAKSKKPAGIEEILKMIQKGHHPEVMKHKNRIFSSRKKAPKKEVPEKKNLYEIFARAYQSKPPKTKKKSPAPAGTKANLTGSAHVKPSEFKAKKKSLPAPAGTEPALKGFQTEASKAKENLKKSHETILAFVKKFYGRW